MRHGPDLDDSAERRTLPRFVTEELRAFLACGIAAHGFCRVHCPACGKDELIAFSCKRRGFCHSCCGRRMADTAAFLVDEVLPAVPVRQWVLSLPHTLRVLCGCDPGILRAVRALFVRAVSLLLLRQAPRGLPRARPGAIVFVQRCDSALRLDVHFHALFTDGVFACGLGERRATFHPLAELADDDVARVVRKIHTGVQRFLRKKGLLREPDEPADSTPDTDLLRFHGASAEGRAAARITLAGFTRGPRPRTKSDDNYPDVGGREHESIERVSFCFSRRSRPCERERTSWIPGAPRASVVAVTHIIGWRARA